MNRPKNIRTITSQSRDLTDLKNIGNKIAGRLNEIGIFSEADLRQVGPVDAHRMIKQRYPDETLSALSATVLDVMRRNHIEAFEWVLR